MSVIKSAQPGFGIYEYNDDPADRRTSKRPASPTESLMEPPKNFRSVLKVDIKTGRILDGCFNQETGRVLYEKRKGDEKMPAKSPIPGREEVIELIKTCRGSINKMAQVRKVGWSTAKNWVEHHGLTEIARAKAGDLLEALGIKVVVGPDIDKVLPAIVKDVPEAEARQRNIDEDDDGIETGYELIEELPPVEKELLSAVNEAEVAKVNRREVIIELAGRMMEFPTRGAALDYIKKTVRLYELKVEMVPVPLSVAVEEREEECPDERGRNRPEPYFDRNRGYWRRPDEFTSHKE